jgi:hypothetical protein
MSWSPVCTSVTFCTGPPVISTPVFRSSASPIMVAKPLP